jgi:flagellar biosynthesis/type III secretory pathway protein FliH
MTWCEAQVADTAAFAPRWNVCTGFTTAFGTSDTEMQVGTKPAQHRASDAADEAFVRGHALGVEEAKLQNMADTDAMCALTLALNALAPIAQPAFEALLAELIISQVRMIVDATPITAAELQPRIAAAIALLPDDVPKAAIFLHPDDAALIDATQAMPDTIGFTLHASEAVPRGTLRIEYAGGQIIHGRAPALDGIATQLGATC